MAALKARPEPDRAPAWLWALSWIFWLAISAGVAGLGVHKVKVHKEQLHIGDETWRIRYEICKRLSAAPRPDWRECRARIEEPDPTQPEPNLLGPTNHG